MKDAAGAALWDRCLIKVLDIRKTVILRDSPLSGYCLPAGVFIHTVGGQAEIYLGELEFSSKCQQIFHAGKGTTLTIQPLDPQFICYMTFYRMVWPLFGRKEISRMLADCNPFARRYGFIPSNPVLQLDWLGQMLDRWHSPSSLDRLFVKSVFYQLIYEICADLQNCRGSICQTSLISQITAYLNAHYRKDISILRLAELFSLSKAHLYRLFKGRHGITPQEYILRLRVQTAREQLLSTEATVKDIAYAVGFTDEFHFSRTFKKYTGMSPRLYRTNNSSPMRQSVIPQAALLPYSKKKPEGQWIAPDKGENFMLGRNYRNAVAAMAISLMLMLAACGGGTAVPGPSAGGETTAASPAASASAAVPEQTQAATRIVSTAKGDVEIPASPQRIVSTYFIGELAALGVKPVGTVTRQLGEEYPLVAEFTKGVADIGASPNVEAITALDPDLIIAMDMDGIDYETYAKIAPTLVIPWLNDDVWAKLRTLGKFLDKEAEAEAYIAEYEQEAIEAREAIKGHIDPEETIAILSMYDKTIGIFGGRNIGYSIYNGLKLNPPPKVKEIMESNPNFASDWSVSLETLPDFAADRIILVVQNESAAEMYKEIQKSALWKGLPAVKNNKVYEVPLSDWFTYDAITVRHTLAESVKLFTSP